MSRPAIYHLLAGAFLAAGAAAQFLPAAADAASNNTPSIVLVHGAFADGSSWNKVIPLLEAKGLKVIAVQNPLSSLADDVAATKRAIDAQPGSVILVGHSWGGTVITEAGTDPKVTGLVYVAAAANDVGQSFNEMAKPYPVPPGLTEAKVDGAGYASLSDQGIAKYFAQDVKPAEAALIAATQGPVRAANFDEKVTAAAWQSKPSWYIVAAKDFMIQPDLERALAKKIGATTTVLPTSHVPMVSEPAKVAAVILEAAAKAGSR